MTKDKTSLWYEAMPKRAQERIREFCAPLPAHVRPTAWEAVAEVLVSAGTDAFVEEMYRAGAPIVLEVEVPGYGTGYIVYPEDMR